MLLPTFLIPKNLVVGDSFNFKIFEGHKYGNKITSIYDIQKKYSKHIYCIVFKIIFFFIYLFKNIYNYKKYFYEKNKLTNN